MSAVFEGTLCGVSYDVFDFTALIQEGVIPGFYYSAGDDEEDEVPGTETVILEGPYATSELAIIAAHDFIMQVLTDMTGELIDYAAKCKRRRDDGPTPCLCCPDECVG